MAITTSRRGNSAAWRLTAAMIRGLGGRSRRVNPTKSSVAKARRAWDALVLLGGTDIDPLLYGGVRDPRRKLDPARDELELELLDEAITRGVPVLGICRGAQLMNVHRGGSLARFEPPRRRTPLPRRRVAVAADSRLRTIVGKSAWANSLHEYAVDDLGDGYIASGIDSGGVVQAIERPGPTFELGVQWHPELMPYLADSRRLFRSLLAAADASK